MNPFIAILLALPLFASASSRDLRGEAPCGSLKQKCCLKSPPVDGVYRQPCKAGLECKDSKCAKKQVTCEDCAHAPVPPECALMLCLAPPSCEDCATQNPPPDACASMTCPAPVSCHTCLSQSPPPEPCSRMRCAAPVSCEDCATRKPPPAACASMLCTAPVSCEDCATHNPPPDACASMTCPAPVSCEDCATQNPPPDACASMTCPAPVSCDDCATQNPPPDACASMTCPAPVSCEDCATQNPPPDACASMTCPAPCICTKFYLPVCGVSAAGRKTYGNKCEAHCAGVHCWVKGACKKELPKLPSDAPKFCPMVYSPVCGYSKNGKTKKTYGNTCVAQQSAAFCWKKGACEDDTR